MCNQISRLDFDFSFSYFDYYRLTQRQGETQPYRGVRSTFTIYKFATHWRCMHSRTTDPPGSILMCAELMWTVVRLAARGGSARTFQDWNAIESFSPPNHPFVEGENKFAL